MLMEKIVLSFSNPKSNIKYLIHDKNDEIKSKKYIKICLSYLCALWNKKNNFVIYLIIFFYYYFLLMGLHSNKHTNICETLKNIKLIENFVVSNFFVTCLYFQKFNYKFMKKDFVLSKLDFKVHSNFRQVGLYCE